MDLLLRYLAIGSGGFLGTVARYGLATSFGRWSKTFPVGTLVINVTGSFILGWFAAYSLKRAVPENFRLAVGVGFVGGYTTFSTYMLESNNLLRQGAGLLAMLNLFGSIILGLVAVYLGLLLAQSM